MHYSQHSHPECAIHTIHLPMDRCNWPNPKTCKFISWMWYSQHSFVKGLVWLSKSNGMQIHIRNVLFTTLIRQWIGATVQIQWHSNSYHECVIHNIHLSMDWCDCPNPMTFKFISWMCYSQHSFINRLVRMSKSDNMQIHIMNVLFATFISSVHMCLGMGEFGFTSTNQIKSNLSNILESTKSNLNVHSNMSNQISDILKRSQIKQNFGLIQSNIFSCLFICSLECWKCTHRWETISLHSMYNDQKL